MIVTEKRTPLTVEQLLELRNDQRADLAQFVEILKNHTGDTSPAENFIRGLVRHHNTSIPLTPENLEDDLETFRENFTRELATSRCFVKQYPAEVLGENCGGWADQIRKLKAIVTETDGADWEDGAQARIEMAREAIKLYPALVLSGESWEEVRKSMAAGMFGPEAPNVKAPIDAHAVRSRRKR